MKKFAHRFVEFIPEVLEECVLYVSLSYSTASHRCACGCGREVVTPLTPTDWKLIFDGETVTLYPSIGNWDYPCRSHYWIRNGRVEWAEDWSKPRAKKVGMQAQAEKTSHYAKKASDDLPPPDDDKEHGLWWRLRRWW